MRRRCPFVDMVASRVMDWMTTSVMSRPNIGGSFLLDVLHGVVYSCICDCSDWLIFFL